jgi:pyruvyltransferase
MPSKTTKIQRKLFNYLGINNGRKIRYHLGRPNFGDDVNEWFFSKLLDEHCVWGGGTSEHILGIGSVAEKSNENSIVCGSGFISEQSNNYVFKSKKVISLRGQLSCQIAKEWPEYIGDPMVMIDKFLPVNKSNKFKFGIIPHESNFKKYEKIITEQLRNLSDSGVKLINPADHFLKVIHDINQCEHVISQSLHGLICADAYNIPNAWIGPSEEMRGGDFKFNDYFSTTDFIKVKFEIDNIKDLLDTRFYGVSNYRWGKTVYMEYLRNLLNQKRGSCL